MGNAPVHTGEGQAKAPWPISGSTRDKPICCPFRIQSVTCDTMCTKTWRITGEKQVHDRWAKPLFFKGVQVSLNSHCSQPPHILTAALHPPIWRQCGFLIIDPFICHTRLNTGGPVLLSLSLFSLHASDLGHMAPNFTWKHHLQFEILLWGKMFEFIYLLHRERADIRLLPVTWVNLKKKKKAKHSKKHS